jgi:hypothetical protein
MPRIAHAPHRRSRPAHLIAAGVILALAAGSAMAQTAKVPGVGDVTGSAREPASGDVSASRNATRSRLRECGHQWSAMKKSGAAAGMTWKEFSQGCLAKP